MERAGLEEEEGPSGNGALLQRRGEAGEVRGCFVGCSEPGAQVFVAWSKQTCSKVHRVGSKSLVSVSVADEG